MKILIDILFVILLILLLTYSIYRIYKDYNDELSDTKNEVFYLNTVIQTLSKENKLLREKYNDTLKDVNTLEDVVFYDEEFWNINNTEEYDTEDEAEKR